MTDPITASAGAINVAEKPKIGRPSDFGPEIATRIIDALAEGAMLAEVCREEWAPNHATIYRWSEKHAEFRDALARARTNAAHRLVCEAVRIIDDVDPESKFGASRVAKAREQAGLRRWLAGCLDRDTYGERPPQVAVTVNNQAIVAFGRMIGKQTGE